LAIETLGPGRGVGEAGEDDGKFLVLFSVLGDSLIESAEIFVGQRIEHCRVPHFVQGALHRSPPLNHLAGELENDAAVPVWPAFAAQPIY
jgi:hypothetical protein